MSIDQRIDKLVQLGIWLMNYQNSLSYSPGDEYYPLFEAVTNAHFYNPWLIEPFVNKSISLWASKLSKESFQDFYKRYPLIEWVQTSKNIAVISQKNIPLGGFHDFICVIITGHRFYSKNANHEFDVLKIITKKLIEFEPAFEKYIFWCDHYPKQIDAYLIYTSVKGNIMNQYFDDRQSLVRKKRISVAVILENDTAEDFQKIISDAVLFFGLSSWNIRKLYVPEEFTVDNFFPVMENYSFIYKHNRYANNFDYHRSVLLLNQIPFFENGFMIMRESSEFDVPIGCLYYEYYSKLGELRSKLSEKEQEIQQIITNSDFIPNTVKPGEGHQNSLYNFDDHKDILKFLKQL